jgi:predicted DNA-binding transcriptional regulator AlpA
MKMKISRGKLPIGSSAPDGVVSQIGIYHGVNDPCGRLQIKKEGQKMWGIGVLTKAVAAACVLPKTSSAVVAKAPQYVRNEKLDICLPCVCATTGAAYLFEGQLVPTGLAKKQMRSTELSSTAAEPADRTVLESPRALDRPLLQRSKDPAAAQLLSFASAVPDAGSEVEDAAAKAQSPTVMKKLVPKQARARDCKHDFKKELARVLQLQAAGVDPDVKIPFVLDYLGGISRPTAYRKMKLGKFPMRVKRDSSAMWPFSVIEAYKLGQWTPEASLGTGGGGDLPEKAADNI